VLNSATNPVFASIFSRESAVGSAKESVMGNLFAANIDNGWGAGGWGVVGTGLGGGGTGEDTIGIGRYGTLGGRGYGPGSGDGPGSGYGPGGGGLRPHHTISPSVIPGTVTTRGTLDKEIVRRVVHLHMNEVKYCYDKELVRKTGLEGRVSVQFIIAANGQVINSFMNSTTMNNVNVEKCVIDAVKRWQFPSPAGGGIVIVSYPFNFTAGSGN
jgi:TonB family protein